MQSVCIMTANHQTPCLCPSRGSCLSTFCDHETHAVIRNDDKELYLLIEKFASHDSYIIVSHEKKVYKTVCRGTAELQIILLL